jgi:Tol biopolymer transport system component
MSITNLTNNHLYEISPIWSRDEKNLYYVLEIGSEYSIAQMRLEDRNIKRLYTCESFIFDLSLSPDGEKIIFSSLYDLYHSSLWILNLKNGTVKQITSGQYLDTSPVFYTDNEIFFISNRIDDENNIFKMKLDEDQPHLIPGSTDSYKIINTSDSRCLFYTVNKSYSSGNYYVIDLDSERVERYFDEGGLDIWFPLLRDGKLIYFRGDNLKNIVREEITLD